MEAALWILSTVINLNPVPKNKEKLKCRCDCHIRKTELQEEQHILNTVLHFLKLFIPRNSDQYIYYNQQNEQYHIQITV
jgi:hypothetical protein